LKHPVTVGHKNVAVNFLQQLLQRLTDFGNFCIKLTRNEQRISGYQNVSLHLACVSTLPCKIRKQRFFHVSTETFTLNTDVKFLQEVYKHVQNVRLQRQHRLTDDVATDQWHHPQRAVPVHTMHTVIRLQ